MKYLKIFAVCLGLGLMMNSCGGDEPGDEIYDGDGEVHKKPLTGEINGHAWVDLGLPSGTKWATMNIGATKSYESGYFYAWGEVEYRLSYEWTNYKWGNGGNRELTKYNCSVTNGTVDDLVKLTPEDDAATVNWGKSWSMPTERELKELVDNCVWTWENVDGYNCVRVTSKNGQSILFPAVGHKTGSRYALENQAAQIWTSTVGGTKAYASQYGYDFYYSQAIIMNTSYNKTDDVVSYRVDCASRNLGFPVRPVTK